MKSLAGIILVLLVSCATYGQSNLNYTSTDKINSASSINIVNVDEFIEIINDNNIRRVFYTENQFIVQGNSLVYTINKKGYDNLDDYRLGDGKFSGGESYYLAQEVGLNNQEEVDAYKTEAYITIADYKDALRLGFVRNNYAARGNIHGLVSGENLRSSLRYANVSIYLRYNYTWPGQSSNRRRQQNSDTELLGNTDIDFLAGRSNGAIKKLNNYDYYIINIPLLDGKESFLYYACKMAQYDDFQDYKNKTGTYSVKNTDAILGQLGYKNLDDLARADANGINNSADYYLTVNYRISKNDLDVSRGLIEEIETIKKRYNTESIPDTMMLNYLLKQPKGLPFSTRAMVGKFNQEYRNNAIVRAFGSPNEAVIGRLFTELPQLNRLIMYNQEGESLYMK